MIFGLFAAVGWGLADFGGAVVARRLGSMPAVVLSQGFTAVVMTGVVLVTGHGVGALGGYVPWFLAVGALGASAYALHFRALRLGPVALVSPVGATYALVGLTLAVVVLGERPSGVALAGGVITVVGVMLASADLPKLRTGTHGLPPALPFALLAALMFGVGGFILAWLSRQVGWVLAVWGARMVQVVMLGALALAVGGQSPRSSTATGAPAALAVGLADLVGLATYAAGAEHGYVSVVIVASCVFPLIAVALSVLLLHERPVANQYVGVGLVAVGLLMVGLG